MIPIFKAKLINCFVLLLLFFSFMVYAKIDTPMPRKQEWFPLNKGTIYDYGDESIHKVFFFPVDEARWDGSKITPKEWRMLTDFQKVAF